MNKELSLVKESALKMAQLTSDQKNEVLQSFSELLITKENFLLEANHKDLEEQKGKVSKSIYQRLGLNSSKIKNLAQGMLDLKKLKDPVGEVTLKRKLDEGLILSKVSVPIGVLGVIFESRPDAAAQILSLVLKSGNATVLKGGKEAKNSNQAMKSLVDELNTKHSFLPKNWAVFLETRSDVDEMLKQDQYIDMVIPRGSQELVQKVMNSTHIPVLGHADGICHIYVDKEADLKKSIPLIIDAKIQYPSACNAVETVLIDKEVDESFLRDFIKEAHTHQIQLFGCEKVREIKSEIKPTVDWAKEYGDRSLSIKIVNGLEEATAHINHYGSGHTDAILTENQEVAKKFVASVDSANVFVNASTRFADGFRYGFGAEMGISTSKTHARGPVGLEGLVIYKYIVEGQGQVVKDYTGDHPKEFLHEDLG